MKRPIIELLPLLCIACLWTGGCEGAEDRGKNSAGDADADADTDADADSDADTDTGAPAGGCTKVDILFVIDDSGSMQQEQENLVQNFPAFIGVLEDYLTPAATPLEYRVGVITTSVNRNYTQSVFGMNMPSSSSGPDGALQGQDCGLGDHPWLDGPGGEENAALFSCMATVGTTGSGTEMPFAAMHQALLENPDNPLGVPAQSAPGGPNEGFYRKGDDSLLVVVIITDEDDCSIQNGGVMTISMAGGADCNEETSIGLYKAATMIQFLDDLTGGGDGRYVVVGIAGMPPNGCSATNLGSAIGAVRVKELIDLAGEWGVFGDICDGDLAGSLAMAMDKIQLACDEFPIW